MKLLVFDFGGSAVKYSIIDEKGNRTSEGLAKAPTESKEQYKETIKEIYTPFKDMINGIAISAPGYIDPIKGIIKGGGAYLQMNNVNVYELLKDEISVPVAIENDGNCAALAEAWNGSLKDVNDGVVLIIGTGYAGGIIYNKKIIHGNKNMAGEFSFIGLKPDLDLNKSVMGAGSMLGLVLKANIALGVDIGKTPYAPYAPIFGINQENIEPNDNSKYKNGADGPMIFELIDEGNEKMCALYDEFIDAIASALMNIQCVLDPEVIALGGAVMQQDRILIDLQKRIDKYDSLMGGGMAPHINVVRCQNGKNANEIGAAYNWMQLYGKEK